MSAVRVEVPKPRRRLSLFDVVCIGVNATIGSGVFALPDDLQRAMGGWSPLAYVLCAVLLLPVALCFAELSSRLTETGGAYVYARVAFGDRVGFIVGWYCWINTFISWGANSRLFTELAGVSSPIANKLVSVGTIALLGAINYVGVKPGAWLVNAVTVAKLAAIGCFLVVALGHLHGGALGGHLPEGVRGAGVGVYLALYPLQGFEVTSVPAGETENPGRNMPLATIAALVFSGLVFVAVQAALVSSYPALADKSDTPLVDAARSFGPIVAVVVLVGGIVSVGGFNAGSALGAPRYAQAIAEHGLLPRALAKVHPRYATPHVAIVVTSALAAILAANFDYRALVGMSNVAVVIQYVAACLAVPLVRKKSKAVVAGWRVPGTWALPVLGAVGSIALVTGAERAEFAFAGGSLVLALIAMIAWRPKARP